MLYEVITLRRVLRAISDPGDDILHREEAQDLPARLANGEGDVVQLDVVAGLEDVHQFGHQRQMQLRPLQRLGVAKDLLLV